MRKLYHGEWNKINSPQTNKMECGKLWLMLSIKADDVNTQSFSFLCTCFKLGYSPKQRYDFWWINMFLLNTLPIYVVWHASASIKDILWYQRQYQFPFGLTVQQQSIYNLFSNLIRQFTIICSILGIITVVINVL